MEEIVKLLKELNRNRFIYRDDEPVKSLAEKLNGLLLPYGLSVHKVEYAYSGEEEYVIALLDTVD